MVVLRGHPLTGLPVCDGYDAQRRHRIYWEWAQAAKFNQNLPDVYVAREA